MGQEHPRVPGHRSPGRPVFPVEGKAVQGGLEGAPAAWGSTSVQLGQRQGPGNGSPSPVLAAPSCPAASGEAPSW